MKGYVFWGILTSIMIQNGVMEAGAARGAKRAVIIVPVADMLKVPLADAWQAVDVAMAYQMLPYCQVRYEDNRRVCPRTHQVLFNTIVEIIGERGDEVYVRVPNLFLVDKVTGLPRNAFWTHRKNLVLLDELAVDVRVAIPVPIDFFDQESVCSELVVTLTQPFGDACTGMTFSVGTRFFRAGDPTPEGQPVHVLSEGGRAVTKIVIPHDVCVVGCEIDCQARVERYVTLLRDWARQCEGKVIPYVWGGCSFIDRDDGAAFEKQSAVFGDATHDVFVRPARVTGVKSGFDCSGMILRAAQICGIPYFYKNSHTVPQYLFRLNTGELPANGDIIQYRGHVMIVSDVARNLVLETCGYTAGFGVVHELPLSRVFKGIETYSQLINRLRRGCPLERLAKDGTVARTIDSFTILKISSAWQVAVALPASLFSPLPERLAKPSVISH